VFGRPVLALDGTTSTSSATYLAFPDEELVELMTSNALK